MGLPSVILFPSAAAQKADLAGSLLRAGILRLVVRSGPDLEILEPGPLHELRLVYRVPFHRFSNRLLWAIRRRLPLPLQGLVPQLQLAFLLDSWVSRWIPRCDVFHGLMGVCLTSLNKAKRLGAVTLVDGGTLHPAALARETLKDYSEAGVRPTSGAELGRLIRRSEKQFEVCDRIIAYSRAAAESFSPYRYSRKVAVVNPGIDHECFSPDPDKRPSDVFRVCYVGRIQAPKGIHYLVDAW